MEFQKTIPRSVTGDERAAAGAAIAKGVADSLGLADIRVFGLSSRTHFADVLVEADYRMKRIAIGTEPPPIRMTTFIDALQSPQQGMLQRWWFTPDYKCVKLADDRLAAELVGQGVQLLAEDKLIGADGSLTAAGARPNKASELFTLSFTRKYPEIAAASPVYAQLRMLIDLAIAAALIRRHDCYAASDWDAAVFRDEKKLSVETLPEPKRVPCVVNSLWKGSRLFTPAGGGISIRPDEALEEGNLLPDENGSLRRTARAAKGCSRCGPLVVGLESGSNRRVLLMRMTAAGSFVAVLLALIGSLGNAAEPPLPVVVLMGDSIRLGYAPLVAKRLEGKAIIVSPRPNGGDSSNVLKLLEKEVIAHQPAIVHFNCGIHDTKKTKTTGQFQVPPDQYEANLRKIVERLRKETKAKVLFATTTPVIDDRAAKSRTKAEYELLDASTQQYNAIATAVMKELDVPVDDLRAALGDADAQAKLLGGDGIHFGDEGKAKLAAAVAEFLLKQLPAARP